MDEVRGFNESHHLSGVIKDGLVVGSLPVKAEEIDLRFLSMIRLGDTYNGGDDPSDGMSYQAVLYGNQIAWERWEQYLMGSREQKGSGGNELYRQMYFVARLYLKIQAIGRAKFFREMIKAGMDTFYVNEDDLMSLWAHPQFKEMVKGFGLLLSPVKGEPNRFTVSVTKFYERR
ncbi:MAG: hypothetical protein ACYC1K_02305 [Minisyncoccota bacterium]